MGPVAVIGIGLIGGSLGLALRERAGVGEVRGYDADPAAVAGALEVGAITHGCGSIAEAVEGADVAFLAAPVGVLGDLAREVLGLAGPDCVVTDVGSTKGNVFAKLDGTDLSRFIGGHPICGSERGGVAHSRADLFAGATYFLTPTQATRSDLYQRLHSLVGQIGAQASAIDADVHDRLLALLSHLPHVIASALIHQAAATAPQGREALRSAGPSFVDLTRVAGANPVLWADILIENAVPVQAAIADQAERLGEVSRAIGAGDRAWLTSFMEGAAAGRARLREAPPEVLAEPWRVVVAMPNRPGVISEVATILGHAHINIEDLSLRSGAGEDAGELDVVVAGEVVAGRAVDLVVARGFTARSEPVT